MGASPRPFGSPGAAMLGAAVVLGYALWWRKNPSACPYGLRFFVGRDIGIALYDEPYDEEACRAGDGTARAPVEIGPTGYTVSVEAVFDGWGYVHPIRNGEGKLRELDTYAIPEAHDERFAEGFGDLSVHEVAMSEERNGLAYFSYYSPAVSGSPRSGTATSARWAATSPAGATTSGASRSSTDRGRIGGRQPSEIPVRAERKLPTNSENVARRQSYP